MIVPRTVPSDAGQRWWGVYPHFAVGTLDDMPAHVAAAPPGTRVRCEVIDDWCRVAFWYVAA